MWRFYLMDADAPEAVKDAARHYFLRYSGPGGMTAADERPIVQSKKEKPNALVAYEPKSAEIFQLIYEALAVTSAA